MRDLLLIIGVGLTFGVICGKLHLPSPAPATIIGVIGVVAVTAGYIVGRHM